MVSLSDAADLFNLPERSMAKTPLICRNWLLRVAALAKQFGQMLLAPL